MELTISNENIKCWSSLINPYSHSINNAYPDQTPQIRVSLFANGFLFEIK